LALFALAEQDLPGHLQPLGSHQAPEPPIREVQGFPSPLEFYDEHVVKSAPVLMKGAAKGAQEHCASSVSLRLSAAELPIYETWTDEYMKKNFGHELVEVEEGKKVQRARSI